MTPLWVNGSLMIAAKANQKTHRSTDICCCSWREPQWNETYWYWNILRVLRNMVEKLQFQVTYIAHNIWNVRLKNTEMFGHETKKWSHSESCVVGVVVVFVFINLPLTPLSLQFVYTIARHWTTHFIIII